MEEEDFLRAFRDTPVVTVSVVYRLCNGMESGLCDVIIPDLYSALPLGEGWIGPGRGAAGHTPVKS